ncbi:MAG: alpha/beta hydrolase [bacterium]|nr:alpha/beta hydrolase [bacterium]
MRFSKIFAIAILITIFIAGQPSLAAKNYSPKNAFIPDKNYIPDLTNGADNFYKSKTLYRQKVSFRNMYGIRLKGVMFSPKDFQFGVKYPAIIVGHPMGATKEQSAMLYAQKMAERGYITLAMDLSFWGKSAGYRRNTVAPEIFAEDFSAAVDFLGTRDFVDKSRIGVIGICGSGSFALSAAKIDPRIKAVATVSMYDMGTAARNGLNNSVSLEERKLTAKLAAYERYNMYLLRPTQYTGGTDNELTENTNPIQKEFYDFYRTSRGAVGDETSTHPTLASNTKFMNFYPLEDLNMISPRAVLFITGDNAHSKEFSEKAYKKASEPKELYYVKNAGHVDLYDRVDLIPFDKLAEFFAEYMK